MSYLPLGEGKVLWWQSKEKKKKAEIPDIYSIFSTKKNSFKVLVFYLILGYAIIR